MIKEVKQIGIVGNPNSGKTTVFNALTGATQRVGNWPGVTVEKIIGEYTWANKKVEVVDLPGIYSLSTSSLDEDIAKQYIFNEDPHLIINVIDASNLERNLYLTVQLIEMCVPLLIVLNMMDIVKQKRLKIKIEKLAELLDCPVVCVVANKAESVDKIKEGVDHALDCPSVSKTHISFPLELQEIIDELVPSINFIHGEHASSKRWAAIELLEGNYDRTVLKEIDQLTPKINLVKQKIKVQLGDEIDILVADARYGFINSLCKKVVDKSNIVRKNVTDIVDKVVLNKFFGIPIFLAIVYFMFWITISIGGCFIDFFDMFFGTIFVDGFAAVLTRLSAPEFIITFFAEGLGGGIQTISTFVPPIFFMFFCLSILEDSGYMSRAAFVMDGAMRKIGLPGKAFVPMLVGFGCNVPAIMSTRTLEKQNDRILTVLMNPFMSCGARMPVYVLFTVAFFPNTGNFIVFSLYLVGIFFAGITGFLLRRTLLESETSPFIMELPPYHMPSMRSVLIHTWQKLKAFMFKAGKAILMVVVVLTFFGSIGTDGSYGNKDSTKSLLAKAGQVITPVFKPMGLKEENWPAAVGLITGVFAKEAVIGTLDNLYVQIESFESVVEENQDNFGIKELLNGIIESFASIISNFVDLFSSTDKELDVNDGIFDSMRKYFDGKAGAYAYLLLVLLYVPCVASIAAVYKELGIGWTMFSCGYLLMVAWMAAVVFYQTVRFSGVSSLLWIGAIFMFCFLFFKVLKAFACSKG